MLASEELAEAGALLTKLAAAGERRGNYEQTLRGAVEHILYQRHRQELKDLRASGDSDQALRELAQRLKSPDIRRHPKIR